jgi:urease accessory protein
MAHVARATSSCWRVRIRPTPRTARGAAAAAATQACGSDGPVCVLCDAPLVWAAIARCCAVLEDRMREATVFQVKEPLDVLWSLSPVRGEAGDDGRIVRVAGKETEDVKKWLSDALRGLVEVIGGEVYSKIFI